MPEVPDDAARETEREIARIAGAVVRMLERDAVEEDLRRVCRVSRDDRGVELFAFDVSGDEPWLNATAHLSHDPQCPPLRFTASVRAAVCTCGDLWIADPRFVTAEQRWRLEPVVYPARRPRRR